MKKIGIFILSLSMIIGLIPSVTFAQEPIDNQVEVTEAGDQTTEQSEVTTETDVQDQEVLKGTEQINEPLATESLKKATESRQTEDKKVVQAVVDPYQVTVKQKQNNFKTAEIAVPQYAELKKKGITKIEVEATMTYDGNVTQSQKATVQISKMKNDIIEFEFPNYGTFGTSIKFYNGSSLKKTVKKNVNIVADEYNIAPIVATFPVIYFSLNLPTITKNDKNEPVPTFVSLQRPDAYNWDKLPEDVYWQPNLTKKQVETQTSFETKVKKFSDYVNTLYKANKKAKFHLYINDAYEKYILQLMCANGIPENQFDVVLLSDGSGSYANFNNTFDVDNPDSKYAEMASGWKKAKEYAYKNGNYSLDSCPYWSSSSYSTVIANEDENVTWWVGRKAGTFLSTTEFLDSKINPEQNVITKNMNTMMNVLNETQQAAFKKLYNFNDQMFAKAEKEKKKVMLILGSRTTMEPNFGNFSAYAKFLQKQYGDDYVYYYKGHPATPTALYEDKQKQLAALDITDVESSIPAELILYFYPNIYMAGYSSTTFQSVASDEMATGVFGKSKEDAAVDSSLTDLVGRDAFNFYMRDYDDANNDISKEFPSCNKKHDNYIIDFSDAYLKEKNNEYTVAVYDYDNDQLYYYKKQEDSTYKLVSLSMGTVSGIKSVLSMKNENLKINWNELANINGYEVQYKTKYNNAWKTKTVAENNITFKMKNGQTFEYRIRPYATIGENNYYGEWSDVDYRYAKNSTVSTKLQYTKKQCNVSWKKIATSYGTVKYQLAYKVNGGNWNLKNTSKNEYLIKHLTENAVYQMIVRPIKVIDGKEYIGAYSSNAYRYNSTTAITKKSSVSKSKIVVAVTKKSKVTGYEVCYSTKNTFASPKYIKVKGASKTNITINGLKSKKKYYARVRTYKIIDGKTYIGAYSNVKAFTTK